MQDYNVKTLYDPTIIDSLPTANRMEVGDIKELMERGVRHLEINGKLIIQDVESGEFIDYILMDEEVFVNDWLLYFAMGRVGEKLYFDLDSWTELTNNNTKGIIVVNNTEKTFLFSISKFTDMDFSGTKLKEFYQATGSAAAHVKSIPDSNEQGREINNWAILAVDANEQAGEVENEGDRFTNLIPTWFYAKHDVNPDVIKAVIFIRDNYLYEGERILPDTPLHDRIEEIMKKYYSNITLTTTEKEFISKVTNGDLTLDGYVQDTITDGTKVLPGILKESSEYEYDPDGD